MANWCESCLYEEYDGAEEPCIDCVKSLEEIPTEFFPKRPHKPKTNADRIRAMTDEELAEWIETIADCDSCQYSWSLGKCLGGYGTSHGACRLKWLNWLKEEADNGEN